MNKFYGVIGAVLLLSMLLMPLIAVDKPQQVLPASASPSEKSSSKDRVVSDKGSTVRLYQSSNGKTRKISMDAYLCGVVASEMPADFSSQALRAQVVAAHTVLMYRKEENSGKNYDITDESLIDQGYISVSAQREKWGENYKACKSKIKRAVRAVGDYILTYNNEPILAVYHAISGGKTESASNVWDVDYSYLKPVESAGDLLADGYLSTASFTAEEFIAKAATAGVTLSGSAENLVGTPKCSSSGTVLKYSWGEQSLTGQQIRTAFSLRSANFDIAVADDKLVFTVRGFGHGVGMSQYGAEYMAQQGSSWQEILKYYYSGCEIEKAPD